MRAWHTMVLIRAFARSLTGLPTAPHGKRLRYHCNGYLCYYLCIAGVFAVDRLYQHYGIGIPITHLCDNYGQYLLTSILIGDITSVFWYLYGIATRDTTVLSERVETTTGTYNGGGSDDHDEDATSGKRDSVKENTGTDAQRKVAWIYDFFMGTCLYPRIGEIGASSTAHSHHLDSSSLSLSSLLMYARLPPNIVCVDLIFDNARVGLTSYADIKMVSECRWSWLSLMLLTLSCAVKQFREDGSVSWQMGFMVLVRFACTDCVHFSLRRIRHEKGLDPLTIFDNRARILSMCMFFSLSLCARVCTRNRRTGCTRTQLSRGNSTSQQPGT